MSVGWQRRQNDRALEGLILGIEQGGKLTRRVGLPDGGALLGPDQFVGQRVGGSDRGHGLQRGAPVVGGARMISAGLLEAGGGTEDGGVMGIEAESLAQPLFCLVAIVGGQCGSDGSLVVGRGGVLHAEAAEERERLAGVACGDVATGDGAEDVGIVGEGLGSGIEQFGGVAGVSASDIGGGAAGGPVGPESLHGFALGDGEVTAGA